MLQATKTGFESLSPRERAVAELAANGLPLKEVACRLGLTTGTVKVYLSERIYRKLGVDNQAGLIRYWIEKVEMPLRGDCSCCPMRQSMLAVIGGCPMPSVQ